MTGTAPVVRTCIFENNTATTGGAAGTNSTRPRFFDCIFRNNISAERGGAVLVGSVNYSGQPFEQFVNCQFIDNTSLKNGGAISISSGSDAYGGIFQGCTFSGNTAVYGGAIRAGRMLLIFRDCVFTDNSAGLGGALYLSSNSWDSTFTFEACHFAYNAASGGGAVYFEDIPPTGGTNNNDILFTDSTFLGNSAAVFGGAIHYVGMTPRFELCEFTGNSVDPFLGRGGAVYTELQGSAQFTETTFATNVAGDGGAVACEHGSDALVFACLFDGNSAQTGGAIIAFADCDVECSDSLFIEGVAQDGVYLALTEANALLTGTTLRTAGDASSEWILLDGSILEAKSCHFLHDGNVYSETALRCVKRCEAAFSTCLIDGLATGFVFGSQTDFAISHCEFIDCIYNAIVASSSPTSTSDGTVRFCHFEDNGAGNGPVVSGNGLTVEDCVFDGNAGSPGRPIAIASFSGAVNVQRCTFTNHVTTGHYLIAGDENCTIQDCTFLGNTGYILGLGGGLVERCIIEGAHRGMEIFGGPLTIRDCSFTQIAGQFFPRWFDLNYASVDLINCYFELNTHTLIYGQALPYLGQKVRAYNCDFVGPGTIWSEASFNDAALELTNCRLRGVDSIMTDIRGFDVVNVTNCTVTSNDTLFTFDTSQSFWDPSIRVTNSILASGVPATEHEEFIDIRFSLITDGWPGEGNISGDPLFANPANGNYRVTAASPCIDAGHNNYVGLDYPDLDGDGITYAEYIPVDLDGNPRFRNLGMTPDTGCGTGAIVDMGAYERQQGLIIQLTFGDLDDDQLVNAFDLADLLGAWGPCTGCCLADLDVNGSVDAIDLALLLGAWSQ